MNHHIAAVEGFVCSSDPVIIQGKVVSMKGVRLQVIQKTLIEGTSRC